MSKEYSATTTDLSDFGYRELAINGTEVPETTSKELIDDITKDLDRYYDVADSIDVLIEGIKVE